jgi:DNA-binding XRE family transcriptional regulator
MALGTVGEFLGLSKQESALVEVKVRLAQRLREFRTRRRLSQAAVAKLVRSSPSRVAKMETGDAPNSRLRASTAASLASVACSPTRIHGYESIFVGVTSRPRTKGGG